MCLKKQEDVLHSLNLQHVQTLQTAFDSSISLEHWEEAEYYAKKLITGYLLVNMCFKFMKLVNKK